MKLPIPAFFPLLIALAACSPASVSGKEAGSETPLQHKTVMENQDTVYFAGGCFWGTEHFFKQIPGVLDTETGYADSKVPDPTYREVCTGRTGAAETVKVVFDTQKLTLPFLIRRYFETIDPTSLNRQGNDRGTQYRTGIYTTSAADLKLARETVSALQKDYPTPIVVETGMLKNFYPAEDYHQDYLDENPAGYCHISPSLFRRAATLKDPDAPANKASAATRTFHRKTDSELRRELTPEQYAVTRQNATERPYTNEYNDEYRPGIYVDVTTGEPLFASTHKFESGCGWPAFSRPISDSLIEARRDLSHGMDRVEVRSKTGDAHLGHVFNDGPRESGGLRYCINSASLRFIPKDLMEAEGYGPWLQYVK